MRLKILRKLQCQLVVSPLTVIFFSLVPVFEKRRILFFFLKFSGTISMASIKHDAIFQLTCTILCRFFPVFFLGKPEAWSAEADHRTTIINLTSLLGGCLAILATIIPKPLLNTWQLGWNSFLHVSVGCVFSCLNFFKFSKYNFPGFLRISNGCFAINLFLVMLMSIRDIPT